MKLSELLGHVDVLDVHGDADPDVTMVTRDSRAAHADGIFVAIAGERFDGHSVSEAVEAAVVVAERSVAVRTGTVLLRVADSRRALGQVAAALNGHPARQVKMVGVTGTNGKTTITTIVDSALRAAGRSSGRIGTTGTVIDGRPVKSDLTTPEADALQSLLGEMRDAGCEAVAIEVSSIGLVQRRVDGIDFHTAVFTNLGEDHLDFHGTFEAYREAKARLFTDLLRPAGGPPRALLCCDDPAYTELGAPEDRWTYGFSSGADLHISDLRSTARGSRFVLTTESARAEVHTPLIGRYNAQNVTAAIGVLLTLGLELDEAVDAVGQVTGVPGRLEAVPNRRGLTVVVDYAHTPDALAAVLVALREVTRGRLWVVFGCGGDRDRVKRPRMGAAAAAHADRVVVTSDNPRSESPQSIIDDVLRGVDAGPVIVEVDRALAIRAAISQARPGDVVLIAGKGHETTQTFADRTIAFDDRDVARRVLEGL